MKCFIVEKREEQISRCISEMFHCIRCISERKEKSKLLVKCLDVLVKCFIVEKREEQIIRCISEMFHCREKRRANY